MNLTLAKNLLRKESKLPILFEQFFNPQLLQKLRLIVTGSCNTSRHQLFMREKMNFFSKMKLVKTFPRNSMTSGRLSNTYLLSGERYELKNRFRFISLMNLTVDMTIEELSFTEVMMV